MTAQNWVLIISEQHRYQGVSYKSDIIVISGQCSQCSQWMTVVLRVGPGRPTGPGGEICGVWPPLPAGQFWWKVRPEGSQLQPAGRDELPDDQQRLPGGGGATAEDSAQHPQQGRQVRLSGLRLLDWSSVSNSVSLVISWRTHRISTPHQPGSPRSWPSHWSGETATWATTTRSSSTETVSIVKWKMMFRFAIIYHMSKDVPRSRSDTATIGKRRRSQIITETFHWRSDTKELLRRGQ